MTVFPGHLKYHHDEHEFLLIWGTNTLKRQKIVKECIYHDVP